VQRPVSTVSWTTEPVAHIKPTCWLTCHARGCLGPQHCTAAIPYAKATPTMLCLTPASGAGECEGMAQDLEDARKEGAETAAERDTLSDQLADARAVLEELAAARAALE
jgi:hypothetical protein